MYFMNINATVPTGDETGDWLELQAIRALLVNIWPREMESISLQ